MIAKITYFKSINFQNTFWMLMDHFSKIASASLILLFVAKALGPSDFGMLSYVLSINLIFMTISRMGIESILVREISTDASNINKISTAAFVLMISSSLISILLIALVAYFDQSITKNYLWLICISILFQPLMVIDYLYQGISKARESAKIKTIANIISLSIKIYIIFFNFSFKYLALSYVLEAFIMASALIFLNKKDKKIMLKFSFDIEKIRELFGHAYPIIFASISAVLYQRSDQILINYYLGMEHVGLYAAPIKILELIMIAPFVITISLAPILVSYKNQDIQKFSSSFVMIFRFFLLYSLALVLIIHFYSIEIISFLFGNEFYKSAEILKILFYGLIFHIFGTIGTRSYFIIGEEKKIAFRTLIGLIINIIFNIILIPLYGIKGAALSTVISMSIANYFLLFFFRQRNDNLLNIINHALYLKKTNIINK
jgi:O-antigen/teichoic acid export membrane protein